MVIDLVVVIEVLASAILFAGEIKTVGEFRKDGIRLHRQQTIRLHLVVVRRIIRILGDESPLVLAREESLTVGGVQVLPESISLFVSEGISRLYVARASQMAAGRDMPEGLGALHGGTMGDIDNRGSTGSRSSVTYLTDIVLHPHIIPRSGIGAKLQLPRMGIDQEVVLLHVRYKNRVAGSKTVVRPHAIYRIVRLRAGEPRYGETEPVRKPPLPRCMVLYNHMVVECLEVINQVGTMIPFTEILRRNTVAAVHSCVTYLQGLCRVWKKE